MTTLYRKFRRVWFLNAVAVLMLLFTLQLTVVGFLGIAKHGIHYFSNQNWIVIPFYFIYILLDIWILTASLLPIVKINEDGIFAYSLFWKRRILWHQVKSSSLLRTETIGSRGGSTGHSSVSFSITSEPENKSFFTNKGVILKTFIVVSKTDLVNPASLSLGKQLVTHDKIARIDEIVFEYEKEAWLAIQRKLFR